MAHDNLQTRRRLRRLVSNDLSAREPTEIYHPRIRGNLTIKTTSDDGPITLTVTKATRGASGTVSVHPMITRGAATSMPRNAVFNTSELLEKIFIGLSQVRDVLAQRRVNKQWKAVIDSSPYLQRRLFLKPTTGEQRWAFDMGYKHLRVHESNVKAVAAFVRPGTLNLSLFSRENAKYRSSLLARAKIAESLTLQHRPKLALAMDKRTIYSKMFVTQPPAYEVSCDITFHRRRAALPGVQRVKPKPWRAKFQVKNAQGVTNRDVWGRFLATVSKFPRAAVYSLDEYVIDKTASKVWVLGVMFPSEDEVRKVVGSVAKY